MNDCLSWLRSLRGRIYATIRELLRGMFGPAIEVGNKSRVRGAGEHEPDVLRQHELTRSWRAMLRSDPWMLRLMVHVRLVCAMTGIFFIAIALGAFVVPAVHPYWNYVLGATLSTIPYWVWIGRWYKRTQDKVWAAFVKRFGKHFHLH